MERRLTAAGVELQIMTGIAVDQVLRAAVGRDGGVDLDDAAAGEAVDGTPDRTEMLCGCAA